MFTPGSPTVICGEIDIVVGMRDRGAFAHAKDGSIVPLNYGDRLAVSRIEYAITSTQIIPHRMKSFDFTSLALSWRPDNSMRFFTVYKFYYSLFPSGPTSFDKIFSYYIITNVDGVGQATSLKPSDRDFSWNTAARDETGSPYYPNGRYSITVWAYDAQGNVAVESETVEVRNE